MKMTLRMGFLLLILVVFVGCATLSGMRSSWGKFSPDRAVSAAVEAGKLNPEMNYYFSGPEKDPLAIVGLNKKFALDNDLWKPVANPQMCMELVACMKTTDMKDNVKNLYGFSMYAPNGEKVGEWFSDVRAKMRFRMGDGNKVVVFTPDQYVPEYAGD